MAGTEYLAKRVRPMMTRSITIPNHINYLPANPAKQCWEKCQQDWHDLTAEEQAFAKLSNSDIWQRYVTSHKYGKQTLNILRQRKLWP